MPAGAKLADKIIALPVAAVIRKTRLLQTPVVIVMSPVPDNVLKFALSAEVGAVAPPAPPDESDQ